MNQEATVLAYAIGGSEALFWIVVIGAILGVLVLLKMLVR
jgi:hypothetical protein